MSGNKNIQNGPGLLTVIGASAGGLNAIVEMVKNIPEDLDVAYCIVLHLSGKGIGDFVVHRLGKVTKMPCHLATDGLVLESGNVYVAPPDKHMLVKDRRIILGSGPEENRFRPSIDVLFRSAAVAYGANAIGVVLSGFLDDGTSGMWSVKRSGGMCIVQDPNEAEYPDMPLSVINNMQADHVVSLDKIGPLIQARAGAGPVEPTSVPEDVLMESRIAEITATGIQGIEQLPDLDRSVFSCPDCGGNLWEVKGDVVKRYRCHIGHAYTEKDLALKQLETTGGTLWTALRMMEERKHMLRKMEVANLDKGYRLSASDYALKQKELDQHIDMLKSILAQLQDSLFPDN